MIIYFSTVRRKRPVKEAGELVQLDWTAKKIIKTIPLYPSAPDIEDDPNPRGNSRGGKGMLISGNDLFVGTYHSLLVFDLDMNLQRKITNNLFVNIHEICGAGENIWVSSTAIDAAILVNRQGVTLQSWWPREERLLQERYGLHPMDIDKNRDNRLVHLHTEASTREHHTHLNSVFTSGRNTYVLLNRQGAIIKIEPDVKIILEGSLIRGAHSPMISEDGNQLLLCSSLHKSIVIYDLAAGKLVKQIDLLTFKEIADLYHAHPDQPFNQSIFVRGLEMIDTRRVLMGIGPAAILEVDIHEGRLLDFYQYSGDVGDAVHGLVGLPQTEKGAPARE